LTVQASFTEQVQRLNLFGPKEACLVTPAVCAGEIHPLSGVATLTVPLWSGLSVEADLAGARARRDAAEATRRASANSVALEAASAYWEVRRAELDLGVARAAFERSGDIERTVRVRVEARLAPPVDLERARYQTMRQAEQVALLQAQLATAQAQLGLALQLDEEVRPIDDPAARAPSLPPLGELVDEALRGRSELAAARATVEADRQAVRSIEGAYWPQLALVGQAGAGNQLFYLPQQREQLVVSAFAGVQLNWLIFDTLSTWTAARDAGYVRDRDAAAAARLRYQVRADVAAAHGRLTAALARRRAAAEGARAAERALALLQRRYQNGDPLVVELILAQGDLTRAEGDLNDAAIDCAVAEAQLQAAIGRL
jgi:outer membrane protein TolC